MADPHVKIDDIDPVVTYSVGSGGSTGPFAIPFAFFSAADIKVKVGDVLLATDAYTVTGTTGYSRGYPGGSVTLVTPAASTTVRVYREVEAKRTSDHNLGSPLDINTLNTDLDKSIAIVQELRNTLRRSVRAPEGDPLDELPAADTRAGHVVGFDGDGALRTYPFNNSGTITVSGLEAFATKSVIEIANIDAGTGFLLTSGFNNVGDNGQALYKRVGSQPSHLGRIQSADGAWWELAAVAVRPEMLGAAGDSTTADRTALFNADAVATALNKTLVLSKQYVVGSAMTFTARVHFEAGAKLILAAGVVPVFNQGFSTDDVNQRIFDFSASGSSFSAKIITPYLTPQMVAPVNMDNATDDSAAIIKAISMIERSGNPGTLLLPGKFAITSPITLGGGSYTHIKGLGQQTWITTIGNIDGFRYTNTAAIEHCTISDLQIRNVDDVTVPTDGYGVRYTAPANAYATIENVTVRSKYGGVGYVLNGATVAGATTINLPRLRNVNLRNIFTKGYYSAYTVDPVLDDVHISMQSYASGVYGMHISKWTQALHARGVICLSGQYPLIADNASSRSPDSCEFNECVFDGGGTRSVALLQSTHFTFVGGYASSIIAGADAVYVGAGAAYTDFRGMSITNTARYGVRIINGSQGTRLLGCMISNCSIDTLNTYDGVNIDANTQDFQIDGCRIWNSTYYTGRQRYGIVVNVGTSNNYQITNNWLTGNQTGAISDGGSGATKQVANNVV